jgi:hypothetical protein
MEQVTLEELERMAEQGCKALVNDGKLVGFELEKKTGRA